MPDVTDVFEDKHCGTTNVNATRNSICCVMEKVIIALPIGNWRRE